MFFMIREPDFCRERPARATTALRKDPLALRKNPLATRNFRITEEKQPSFWAKKEEKPLCLWALSSSLYKYTTFFGKMQIALTFRNTPWTVKKTRFAQASGWRVLYYEARMGRRPHTARGDRWQNTHRFLHRNSHYSCFGAVWGGDWRRRWSVEKLRKAWRIRRTESAW